MASEYKPDGDDAPMTPIDDKPNADTSDVTIDLHNDEKKPLSNKPEKPYAGMMKDDLLRFSQTPFWRRFRAALLVIFFLAWLILIAASIAFIVVFPRCKQTPSATWWQTKPIYNIYTRSFFDSNGDGNGDLKGVEMKVDYLKSLGVGTVKLYPIFTSDAPPSNLIKYGFLTSNFTDIDPIYGTLADFDSMVTALHKNNIKLVLDWVINHTSDKHRWFIESRKSNNPSDMYRNYYVWAPCNNATDKPNNWLNVHGGSAWTYDTVRKECYLHQFSSQEPDINFRSMLLREELDRIARFWLDRGVDGFNLVRLQFLVEDYDLRDEFPSGKTNQTDSYDYLDHRYTFGLPGDLMAINRQLRMMQNYSDESDPHKQRAVFVDALGPSAEAFRLYGDSLNEGAQIVFQPLTQTIILTAGTDAKQVVKDLNESMEKSPGNEWPGRWPTSLLYNRRGFDGIARGVPIVTERVANMLKAISFFMQGTPVALYGNEIGMEQDSSILYPAMRPMQWDNSTNSGFSSSSAPWIQLAPKWQSLNVLVEDKIKNSPLNQFRTLSELRSKEVSIHAGKLIFGEVTGHVFSFVRQADGHPGFLVVCNFGDTAAKFDPRQMAKKELIHTEKMKLSFVTNGDFTYKLEDSVSTVTSFVVPPHTTAVFMWDYEIKNHL